MFKISIALFFLRKKHILHSTPLPFLPPKENCCLVAGITRKNVNALRELNRDYTWLIYYIILDMYRVFRVFAVEARFTPQSSVFYTEYCKQRTLEQKYGYNKPRVSIASTPYPKFCLATTTITQLQLAVITRQQSLENNMDRF